MSSAESPPPAVEERRLPVPSWLGEGRSEIANWVVLFTVIAVVTAVGLSLLLSLWIRVTRGLSWDQLGPIGDYWGGHLGGVALVLLALSLLIQRYEFNVQREALVHQQISLAEELKALQENTDQDRAHFILVQLRDLGETLEFAVVSADSDGRDRRRYTGVRSLVGFLRLYYDNPEDIDSIVIEEASLSDFVQIGCALRGVLGRMPPSVKDWSVALLDVLFPAVVERFYHDLIENREMQERAVEALEVDGRLRTALLALVQGGWRFSCTKVGDAFGAALTRDTLIGTTACSSGDYYCANLNEAVGRVLEVHALGGTATR